jgi:hypothetical protein
LLTVGGNPGLRLPHELRGPPRATQAPGNAARAPTTLTPGLFRSVAPSIDRGLAFQVNSLLAQQSEHATPPRRHDVVLAAYQAHLAGRVRYYGPLTPVDLRI